jgi:hypothetical protein
VMLYPNVTKCRKSVFQGSTSRKIFSGELTWHFISIAYLWKRIGWSRNFHATSCEKGTPPQYYAIRTRHHECGRHSGQSAQVIARKFVSKSNAKRVSGSTEENIFRWIDLTFHSIAGTLKAKLADQETFTLRCCGRRGDPILRYWPGHQCMSFQVGARICGEKFVSKSNAKGAFSGQLRKIFQVNWPDNSFHRGTLKGNWLIKRLSRHVVVNWRDPNTTLLTRTSNECGPHSGRRKW